VTRAAVSAERAWHADIMGMPISVRLRGPGLHTPAVQSCVDGAFTWLRRVDAVFSTYRADSDLSRNRRGELPLSACDPLVPDVLELCAQAAAATEGWFDPQVMTSRGRALDPTGIVKGWAVQRAGELLSGLKEHDHYLNAAGDITMIVRDHAAKPWRLGVADPHVPAALVDVVAWRNGGMATSGTAARGGHVYNPFTGRPAGAGLSRRRWPGTDVGGCLCHRSTRPRPGGAPVARHTHRLRVLRRDRHGRTLAQQWMGRAAR